MKEIIVYFSCAEDNHTRGHSVRYLPTATDEEILSDLEHCFGEVKIIDREEF